MFYLRTFFFVVWVLLSALIAIPVSFFRLGNTNNNQLYGRFFGRLGRFTLGIRVTTQGREHLTKHQPCVYVVNHQSAADLALLAHVFPPHTVLIGKKELMYIPIWGLMYWAFGNILIDRKDRNHSITGLKKALEIMKKNRSSVWIFAEGTRNSSTESLLPFKKGAFYMAESAQIPIVPIVCAPVHDAISFKQHRLKPALFPIRVLPPIAPPISGNKKNLQEVMDHTYQAMNFAFQQLKKDIKIG